MKVIRPVKSSAPTPNANHHAATVAPVPDHARRTSRSNAQAASTADTTPTVSTPSQSPTSGVSTL